MVRVKLILLLQKNNPSLLDFCYSDVLKTWQQSTPKLGNLKYVNNNCTPRVFSVPPVPCVRELQGPSGWFQGRWSVPRLSWPNTGHHWDNGEGAFYPIRRWRTCPGVGGHGRKLNPLINPCLLLLPFSPLPPSLQYFPNLTESTIFLPSVFIPSAPLPFLVLVQALVI